MEPSEENRLVARQARELARLRADCLWLLQVVKGQGRMIAGLADLCGRELLPAARAARVPQVEEDIMLAAEEHPV